MLLRAAFWSLFLCGEMFDVPGAGVLKVARIFDFLIFSLLPVAVLPSSLAAVGGLIFMLV